MADTPEPAAKIGRPERVPTAEEQSRICQCLQDGNYREVAVQWGGVPMRTFCKWMVKGKKSTDPKCPFRQFRQAVLDAERMAEMEMVEVVRKAAKNNAKHAQWYLERKFPERWAPNRIELRELKKRVEELEKANASNPAPAPEPIKPADPIKPGAVVPAPAKSDEPLHPDE